jgi:hypothetical protein
MENNNSKEGKRVGLLLIVVLIIMLIITMYEFVQCASGKKGHSGWDKTHVQVVKPVQKSVNTINFKQFCT